jgi:hypothetical protein
MNSVNVSFLTYFTKEFLIQGTIAIESFIKFNPDSIGFVVCLDKVSADYLRKKKYGPEIYVYELIELPSIYRIFKKFLLTRSFAESIISIKPILIYEFIHEIPKGQSIIYFDADIFFFSPLNRIKSVIQDSELVLSRHLFPKSRESSKIFGVYNGGLIIFRNSKISISLLKEWKNLCIEWCELKVYQDKFADQKYLEQFAFLDGVHTLSDPGVNNGQYYFLETRKVNFSSKKSLIFIDDFSVICFHFHGIRVHKNFIATGFNRYGPIKNRLKIFLKLYWPYVRLLKLEIIKFRSVTSKDPAVVTMPMDKVFALRKFFKILNFTFSFYWNKNSNFKK